MSTTTSPSPNVEPQLAADLTPWPHIYVHVPFCGRRCSYCDFAIAVRRDVPASEYIDAIMAEMVTREIAGGGASLKTLYFGGGTPSKLGGVGLASIIGRIARQLDVDKFSTSLDEFELTIEVNPEDVTREAADAWVAAGVNRASIGVQSFDPGVLRWMHRDHSPEQVGESVRILRGAGIQELSLDLIFALPSSIDRSWTRDLESTLELGPDHLSFYGLTVEPATPLGRWAARGEVAEAPEERYEAEFLEASQRLTAAGFEHYEVSNYGLPGKRARHNSAYWSGARYLGLGPSAHGFDGRVSESVYLGLRTVDGLDIHEKELKTVTPWIAAGWGQLAEGRLVLSPLGWLRLDSLAATLAAGRSGEVAPPP